ncbi:MAG TPA: hypothetical protein VI423_00635 [Paenisporosarcina sp.]|nr:hypothetical protein [Paenisporosarcina sp.]
MQTRLDILQYFVKAAKQKQDATYSATMRRLHKENPEKVMDFMKAFKQAFDDAVSNKIESVEQTALLQAIKSI